MNILQCIFFYCQLNKCIMLVAMLTTGTHCLLDDTRQYFTQALSHDGRQHSVRCHCSLLQVMGPHISVQPIAVNRLLPITFKGNPGNIS
jgi:hypothetical protein